MRRKMGQCVMGTARLSASASFSFAGAERNEFLMSSATFACEKQVSDVPETRGGRTHLGELPPFRQALDVVEVPLVPIHLGVSLRLGLVPLVDDESSAFDLVHDLCATSLAREREA